MSDFAEGLITALAGGIAGGAGAMGDIAQKQRETDVKVAAETNLEKVRSDVQLSREKAMVEFRAGADEKAALSKQARYADMAGKIAEERNQQVDAGRVGTIESNLGEMSPESRINTAQALRDNPEARKAYGLINASRADDLAARADIAERLGYADHAKTFRDQQQVELGNTREANRDATSKRQLEITGTHYEDTLAEQIRSNKAREGIDAAGAGLRTIQTDLARLQLERAQQEAKIPAAVNKQLDSFNKEIDILRSAASRSDFDPSTPNGIKVIGDLGKLREEYGSIISPYIQDSGKNKPEGKIPSPEIIKGLRERAKDPRAISAFDASYGEGAAADILNKQTGRNSSVVPANTSTNPAQVKTHAEILADNKNKSDELDRKALETVKSIFSYR